MEFLLHMQSLSEGDCEAWERAIFLNAMPAEVRTVLSNSNAPNNKRLAMEAGQIMEQHLLSKSTGAAYGIEAPHTHEWDAPVPDAPAANAITGRRGPGPRQGNAPRKGTRADTKLCLAHFRFGPQAYSCLGGQCPMRTIPLARRPQAQGNGPAGR